MMALLFVIGITLVDPALIGKVNQAKKEAEKAYQRGDFKTALERYTYLTDSLGVTEEEVKLNLAHAAFQLNDSARAQTLYPQLAQSQNPRIRTAAQHQLGVMQNRQGKFEEALGHFKEALKADPANQEARYNYEMVKKKLNERKKQEEQQQKQDQNQDKKEDKQDQKQDQKNKQDQQQNDQKKQDQQDKDKQEKQQEQQKKDAENQQNKNSEKPEQQKKDEQEQKDEQKPQPSPADKLKEMNMSEEKAKMILEAMKNQEIQYLQQNKRKPSKPKDKGKPDW